MLTEKLVRDRIPDMIRKEGGNPRVRVVSGSELDKLIRLKVVEEALELLNSGEDEEIADILEIIETLMVHRGIDRAIIEKIRLKKHDERGGFEKGYVLDMQE
ncbi:MAG: nucleoside triphosphate pyrophosphohydrolase [Candidatus Thorarchaeota archaeon]